MKIYEAKLKIKQLENELIFLNESKALAFESTQPKALKINEVSVQSSHSKQMYQKLDYSIDNIEPKIKLKKEELNILKRYVNNYFKILDEYDPDIKKIIILREEKNMTWEKISEECHYSEKMCRIKYNEYKLGGKK